MKNSFHYVFVLVLLLLCCQCSSPTNDTTITAAEAKIETKDLKVIQSLSSLSILPSINYKNLQIFMLKGSTEADNLSYTPLQKAMKEKWVEIIETSDVNELAVTNHTDKTIFIHAGDIVKGGKQDRTLAYDMVIAPNVVQEKLSSFCVESDRWHQRGSEAVTGFTSNNNMLSSRDLKIASREANSQTHVWSEVAEQQEKLSSNVGYHYSKTVDVKDTRSASSLDLTLENKDLKALKKLYKAEFKNLDISNATGFACVINGELYYLDVYNNQQLFIDLWDKLLSAAIVEAISDLNTTIEIPPYLDIESLQQSFMIHNESKATTKMLNSRTEWKSVEDSTKVLFTSVDQGNQSKWVHQNLIIRDANALPVVSQQNYYNNAQEFIEALQSDEEAPIDD